MIINIDIPGAKVNDLVDMYQARYGQSDVLIKPTDKQAFLEKVVQHELLGLIRQTIVEKAQREAQAQILADNDIKKTVFESELEQKANLAQQVVDANKVN